MSRFYDADGADLRITTINEYLDVYPDEDELDGPYDEDWPLTLKMAWLSRAAFPSSPPAAAGMKPAFADPSLEPLLPHDGSARGRTP